MTQYDADDHMTTLSVTIRPAGSADTEALARLCVELGYDANPEKTAESLRLVLAHHGHEVLVAETPDSQVAGWIHVFAALRVGSPGFAEIGGLVVDSRLRRRGVGARLVAAAEESSIRLGFGTVRVRSRVERGGTHDFYEDRGFLLVKTQRVYERLIIEIATDETQE